MTISAQESDHNTDRTTRIPDPKPSEFKFIGYWFTRSTVSDIAPVNELLRGQIIGRLFGPNSTNTGRTATYFEQRFVPMFIYAPQILDGVATFRSLFKIDMTWGDNAYGVGGNVGGAINAGQVNLQTLLANVDIHPTDASWNVVIGLQRIFDNVRDPNITAVSTAQTSGYKMSYWGTQGVGISLFGAYNATTLYRAGYYQLFESTIDMNDDVALWMLDVETRFAPKWELGADLWYVWDRGKGGGGISILGQGLNSALADYNGAARLDFSPASKYEADILWAGGRITYNRDFTQGRLWADLFVMNNIGTIDTVGSSGSRSYADIFGTAVNGSLNYKYGMTVNDRIGVEMVFTTGDQNGVSDKNVSSVITGNTYGSPTAIYSNHRALLLFPDPKVVNRYYSAVHDISNMGYGVTGLFLSASHDLIPSKVMVKAGTALAISNVAPTGGGNHIGTEFNIEAQYTYKVFLSFGISAGYLKLGDFYNSGDVTYYRARPSSDPWVVFLTMNWLMF
ncbi:MAG: hypothetical protein HUU02_01740 [Bacteroidetes bacterium]|nr:hypothetical protein [Bacteroidota bacterium]